MSVESAGDFVLRGNDTSKMDVKGFVGELTDFFEGRQFVLMPTRLKWDIERDVIHTQSLHPVPKFSYDYVPTVVTCSNCKQEISYSELESDCAWGEGEEIFNNCICPYCREWDCCDIAFEGLTDDVLLKEMENHNASVVG